MTFIWAHASRDACDARASRDAGASEQAKSTRSTKIEQKHVLFALVPHQVATSTGVATPSFWSHILRFSLWTLDMEEA